MHEKIMLCPSCAGSLTQPKGMINLIAVFKPRDITCPHCGKQAPQEAAHIMATSFKHWLDQFQHHLEAAAAYLPQMSRAEAVEALDPKHFDDEIHHMHDVHKLIEYLGQTFRPVLRDRALGFEDMELTLSPVTRKGVTKALEIYGHCGAHSPHKEHVWTILVSRMGPHGFLTYQVPADPNVLRKLHQAAGHMMAGAWSLSQAAVNHAKGHSHEPHPAHN